jgi:hypothetical protein
VRLPATWKRHKRLPDRKFTLGTIVEACRTTRHFERATGLVKYAVLQLIVTVHLISTKFMCADVFTKATDEQTFKTMISVIRNEPSPDGYAIRAARRINTLMRVSSPVYGVIEPSRPFDGYSTAGLHVPVLYRLGLDGVNLAAPYQRRSG